MRIFVIGQCTLHWGRMEFGNIGNYYIIEPFFRLLHKQFPEAEIVTTFQMSEQFCIKETISCVSMDLYYGWKDNDLDNAYKEFAIASIYQQTGEIIESTPYLDEVLKADLIIDFSGDIWGINADFLGKNRFLVGLLKDRVAQLLGKPTAMLAGSPGPFKNDETLPFAREVFSNFNLVTNREEISKKELLDYDFDISTTMDFACPAFMFEPSKMENIKRLLNNTPLEHKTKPTIGFILCGWNFEEGPFDKWPRRDEEYDNFVLLLSYFLKKNDVNVCFMSHSNGFELPPNFKLKKGRDFPVVSQLYEIMKKTKYSNNVYLMDGLYSPSETKAIIGQFDMLISGRVHAAVAGISQNIPTVILDYGHEPKAHKLLGFARVATMEQYLANPNSFEDMLNKVDDCWENKNHIKEKLEEQNNVIVKLIEANFSKLQNII